MINEEAIHLYIKYCFPFLFLFLPLFSAACLLAVRAELICQQAAHSVKNAYG